MPETNHIKDLIPDPKNARKHNPRNIGMIQDSLRALGAGRSILIDENNRILAGNGTIEAAAQAGITNVRVIETDGNEIIAVKRSNMTEEQKTKYAIMDNRTAELAEWDSEMMAVLSQEVDLGEMFTEKELASILSEPEINEDEAPPLPKEARTKRGDIYTIGKHRVMCGDSTDAGDVALLMDGKKADMVFTDPPYGVSIGKKNRLLNSVQKAGRNLTDIESDDMNADDLKAMLLGAFKNVREVCNDDCSVFVCAPQGGSLGMMMMMMMMMMEAGLPTRHVLNWVKNSPTFSLGRLDYEYQHEPILFTWVKTHKRIGGGQFHTSVWNVDKPRSSKEHPTMKPVELPANAILNHTESNDLVFEPFGGSGTTMIASEQTGRPCNCMELTEAYCDVIVQRWVNLTGGKVICNGEEIEWNKTV